MPSGRFWKTLEGKAGQVVRAAKYQSRKVRAGGKAVKYGSCRILPSGATQHASAHSQPEADGVHRQFGGVVQVEFAHQVFPVFAHGQRADVQGVGNVVRGLPRSDQAEDLLLAAGQPTATGYQVGVGGAAAMALHREAHGHGQVALVQANGIDGVEQLMALVGLGDVALHARLEHAANGAQLDVGGQHEDFQPRVIGAQLANELQAVDPRHTQVQEQQVDLVLGQGAEDRIAVGGLADHLQIIAGGQEKSQAVAHDAMVIGNQDVQALHFHFQSLFLLGLAMPEIIQRKYFVDLLFRQSYAVLFANFVIPLPVAYVFRHAVPLSWIIGWILAMYGLTAIRLLLSRTYFSQSPRIDHHQAQQWGWRASALSWMSSLLWGVLGWVGFAAGDPQLLAFTCVVLTGLVCGAVPSLSAFPPAYAGSLVAMLLPVTLQCLLHSGETYTIYLFFLACLAGVNLYYSRVTYRTLCETIRLRLENVELVGRLEQERDRAQAADQAKSRFLAAASHDLRQPIHALGLFVAGLAALAERGAVRADKAREVAARLGAVIGNLGSLLNGLLDISRLDAGVVVVKREAVSLERLFIDLGDEFEAIARTRQLHWRIHPNHHWVDTDPVLLKRILDNLLSNAFRYTDGGGVLLGCRRRGGQLEIQVFDTGPGIAAEYRGQIFEEFVQLHNPERDRSQGLGLGLAIVRHTARLLGHATRLVSVPGRGSMFSIRVPLAAPASRPAIAPQLQRSDNALGILIIDDEPSVLEALRDLLEVWGHRVYAGASVAQACEQHGAASETGRAAVDLILSDYRLNGMSGLEAIRRARQYLDQAVPAIIITGDTSQACQQETAASHFRVLQKPLDAAVLRDSLKACLDARMAR